MIRPTHAMQIFDIIQESFNDFSHFSWRARNRSQPETTCQSRGMYWIKHKWFPKTYAWLFKNKAMHAAEVKTLACLVTVIQALLQGSRNQCKQNHMGTPLEEQTFKKTHN